MPIGRVRWFSSRKGYGFIQLDSDDEDFVEELTDVFVHYSAIEHCKENNIRVLHEGDKVEFELIESNKGPQARNVIVLEKMTDS